MKQDNFNVHNRRSIRLKGYDYAREGGYFITVCTHGKKCMFGDISKGKMQINQLGNIVIREWLKTPEIRPNVQIDKFVLMPNHFHAIVFITHKFANQGALQGDVLQGGVLQYAPTENKSRQSSGLKSSSQTLGAIVRGFKGATTKIINQMSKSPGKPVWQRNYYESIIRNGEHLNNIRQYIVNNPAKWELDLENPNK